MGIKLKVNKNRFHIINQNEKTKAENHFEKAGENIIVLSCEDLLSLLKSVEANLTDINKVFKALLGEFVKMEVKEMTLSTKKENAPPK